MSRATAGAFWSLSLEVSYYVAIALIVFTQGRIRLLVLVLLSFVAGPGIVILAPIWFLGYWTYHFSQRQQLRLNSGIALWSASTLLLLFFHRWRAHPRGYFFLRNTER